MENAAKALIMAGGILISIAIISVAVYFYTNMKGYASFNQDMLSVTQINSFNRFYTAYETPDQKIRAVDALNIVNRAVEDEVEVDIRDEKINKVLGENDMQWYEIDEPDKYLEEVKYNIEYDVRGQVSKIIITSVS